MYAKIMASVKPLLYYNYSNSKALLNELILVILPCKDQPKQYCKCTTRRVHYTFLQCNACQFLLCIVLGQVKVYVHSLVRIKMATLGERLSASFTLERLLACMFAHVYIHLRLVHALAITVATLEHHLFLYIFQHFTFST